MNGLSFLFRCVVKTCAVLFLFSLLAAGLIAKNLPATNFLDISSLKIKEVIPAPPMDGSNDETMREDAVAICNKKEIKAEDAGDTVFCYNDLLGSDFKAHQLPLTAALFQKVDSDTKMAIHAAKHTFKRTRPIKTTGYSYPSGHSTMAFVWAGLLSNIFPNQKDKLMTQAKQRAWSRVSLGHHYPTDDYTGEIYGKYLAQEFLKNPAFQKEWAKVQREITKKIGSKS